MIPVHNAASSRAGSHRPLALLAMLALLAWPAAAEAADLSMTFTKTLASSQVPAAASEGLCVPGNPFTDATLCNQQYALCISAPCTEVSPADPASGTPAMAECTCEVVEGASVGAGSCEGREPVTAGAGIIKLVSTYSFQQTLPTHRLMTCPASMNGESLRYADCYNMECLVDQSVDPNLATCSCPIFPAGDDTFITRGGNCDTGSCTQIWSGAPTQANTLVNWAMACDIGLPSPPPRYACSE